MGVEGLWGILPKPCNGFELNPHPNSIPPPHLPLGKGEEGRGRKRQLPVLRLQRYWR
jgi:hypothetical protein